MFTDSVQNLIHNGEIKELAWFKFEAVDNIVGNK